MGDAEGDAELEDGAETDYAEGEDGEDADEEGKAKGEAALAHTEDHSPVGEGDVSAGGEIVSANAVPAGESGLSAAFTASQAAMIEEGKANSATFPNEWNRYCIGLKRKKSEGLSAAAALSKVDGFQIYMKNCCDVGRVEAHFKEAAAKLKRHTVYLWPEDSTVSCATGAFCRTCPGSWSVLNYLAASKRTCTGKLPVRGGAGGGGGAASGPVREQSAGARIGPAGAGGGAGACGGGGAASGPVR